MKRGVEEEVTDSCAKGSDYAYACQPLWVSVADGFGGKDVVGRGMCRKTEKSSPVCLMG